MERRGCVADHILERVKFVAEKLLVEETDWLIVKKQILLMLSPKDRKNFTTRDPATKRHQPFNDFEREIRVYWKELTGNTLEMPEEKMLDGVDPADYL